MPSEVPPLYLHCTLSIPPLYLYYPLARLLEALALITVGDDGGGDGASQCAHLARVRVRV